MRDKGQGRGRAGRAPSRVKRPDEEMRAVVASSGNERCRRKFGSYRMPTPPAHPMNDGLSLYPQAGAVSLTLGGGELGHGLIGTDKDQKGWLWWEVHIAIPG